MSEGDIRMQRTWILGLAAAGIGLACTSGASAVPANGTVIGELATATDHVAPVQWGHWRWGSRGGHWRLGSYGYGYGGDFGWGRHRGPWRRGGPGWWRRLNASTPSG